MNQAVKLKGGDVSRKLARVFELDCTDDGDPKLCEEEAEKEDAGAPNNGGKAGAGGSTTGTTTAARELRSALSATNVAACMCVGGTGSTCEEAPLDAASITWHPNEGAGGRRAERGRELPGQPRDLGYARLQLRAVLPR